MWSKTKAWIAQTYRVNVNRFAMCHCCNEVFKPTGEKICDRCIEDIMAEEYREEARYITREMAMDIGEPDMEGRRI